MIMTKSHNARNAPNAACHVATPSYLAVIASPPIAYRLPRRGPQRSRAPNISQSPPPQQTAIPGWLSALGQTPLLTPRPTTSRRPPSPPQKANTPDKPHPRPVRVQHSTGCISSSYALHSPSRHLPLSPLSSLSPLFLRLVFLPPYHHPPRPRPPSQNCDSRTRPTASALHSSNLRTPLGRRSRCVVRTPRRKRRSRGRICGLVCGGRCGICLGARSRVGRGRGGGGVVRYRQVGKEDT